MIEDTTIATDVINVNLDKGLDTVTPPILRDTGSLIDCLNYEIADTTGYRRCDGYERYDGYADGGTVMFYRMQITGASTPAVGQNITGAGLDDPSKLLPNKVLGIVVELNSVAGPTKVVTFAMFTQYNKFPTGYPLSIGGNSYTVITSPTTLVAAYSALPVADYYTKVRALMTYLRSLVTTSVAPIAGLHYANKQLYKAVDNETFTTSGSFAALSPGQLFRWETGVYKVAYKSGTQIMEAYLVDGPYAFLGTLQPLDQTGANIGPTINVSSFNLTPARTAHMVFANNPVADNYQFGIIGNTRGDVKLLPSFNLTFNDGKNATVTPNDITGFLYTSGGVSKGVIEINNTFVETGSFAANNAVGIGSIRVGSLPSDATFPIVGDTVRDSLANILYTIDSVEHTQIPGTAALKSNACHYQWGSYQFLATVDATSLHSFGATGCTRGFWVKRDTYGNIITQSNAAVDIPKYISMHCRAQLALGYAKGTVVLSVTGEPLNYDGVAGASETGMGDQITGLLESQGTSTIVLCRKSIARLSGVALSLQQETLTGKIGAFDYTGANVGGTPVFTNQNGISTLEQSAVYGDFVGEKGTSSISTRLLPKLVDNVSTFELGGTVCAFPVRSKDQYRLVLKDGSVYSLALTSEGPKPMISNWSVAASTLPALAYVPMAWSSEVDAFGKEQIHVAWDRYAAEASIGATAGVELPDPTITYRMDYGWGYDGLTFPAWFDIAHVFYAGGVANGSLEKVRMHGMGWGLATINATSSSLETNYDMSFMTAVQDISMPLSPVLPYSEYSPVTGIVDSAGWGLSVKVRINNTLGEGSVLIEPPHTCQVIQLHVTTDGAIDS